MVRRSVTSNITRLCRRSYPSSSSLTAFPRTHARTHAHAQQTHAHIHTHIHIHSLSPFFPSESVILSHVCQLRQLPWKGSELALSCSTPVLAFRALGPQCTPSPTVFRQQFPINVPSTLQRLVQILTFPRSLVFQTSSTQQRRRFPHLVCPQSIIPRVPRSPPPTLQLMYARSQFCFFPGSRNVTCISTASGRP